jgi:hypothetical protein
MRDLVVRPAPLPSTRTYEQQRRAARARLVQDAHDDGVMVGFLYGLLAGLLFWLLVSGALLALCRWLVWAAMTVLTPGGP